MLQGSSRHAQRCITAVVEAIRPHSTNRRFVAVLDTDVPSDSQLGTVAIFEIVAILIGRVTQVYSKHRYMLPSDMYLGLFCKRGAPKSVFEPGSRSIVLAMMVSQGWRF
jgi:phosphatidylserine decarboxylase